MATDLANIDPQAFFDAQREKWTKQAAEAKAKLDEANGWLAKFDAFEGKKAPQPDFLRPAPKGKRGPRASGSDTGPAKVLAVVRAHPDGISSKDVDKELQGMKSLPNILSKLKKDGLITQDGRGNPYFPASSEAEAA